MAEGGGLLNRYTVKSCIGGSNPPLSAMQSQLQRNSALLLLKYAEKAGFSRYFLYQLDQRKLPTGPLHFCYSGSSPEPPLVVPFQEPAQANA